MYFCARVFKDQAGGSRKPPSGRAGTGGPAHKFCSCDLYSRRLPSHPSPVAAAVRHPPTLISPPHWWTGTPALLRIRREAREATGAATRDQCSTHARGRRRGDVEWRRGERDLRNHHWPGRSYGGGDEATWTRGRNGSAPRRRELTWTWRAGRSRWRVRETTVLDVEGLKTSPAGFASSRSRSAPRCCCSPTTLVAVDQ